MYLDDISNKKFILRINYKSVKEILQNGVKGFVLNKVLDDNNYCIYLQFSN